jgi:3-isopropylmalate dehydratase small subunit
MAVFEGRAWRFGDHVDTDLIIPARFLNVSDETVLARHCFADLRPDFASQARAGDILVAGSNFGCGSSREHAPLAIRTAGIRVIVARSFARVFYRNSFNIGLPALESDEAADLFSEGARIIVDLASGEIQSKDGTKHCRAKPLPGFMRELVDAGGLVNWVRARKI